MNDAARGCTHVSVARRGEEERKRVREEEATLQECNGEVFECAVCCDSRPFVYVRHRTRLA